jgi:hypothetical protein
MMESAFSENGLNYYAMAAISVDGAIPAANSNHSLGIQLKLIMY